MLPERGASLRELEFGGWGLLVANVLRPGKHASLPAGDYTLRVLAEDIRGNQAVANRDGAITKN